jgi:hypothetical protein
MANLEKIVREPLLHFLLLGAAIFVVYSMVSRISSGEPGKIVITQGQLESMLDNFTQTRQRPPTEVEWEGLIRDRVRQEVFYREALALDLDKDDLIIRRRLQQKMEFISDGAAAQAQPTDAELSAYLQAHPDLFRVDPRFAFRQVFLNPEKHGKNLARDAAQLLAELKEEGGKPISLRGAIRSCWTTTTTRSRPRRSGGCSAISSRRPWAGCRSANGKNPSNPPTA